MLTLKYKNGGIEYFGKEEFKNISDGHIREVVYVTADSFELNIIKELFCTNTNSHPYDWRYTIPMTNKREVTWYGYIAKTILANLL